MKSSLEQRRKAARLLDAAKRAVEIAVEEGEERAEKGLREANAHAE